MHFRQYLVGVTGIVAILATSALVAPAANATKHSASVSVSTVFVPATARTGINTHVKVRHRGVLRIDATGAADASANPPYTWNTDPDGNPTPSFEGDEGIYCNEGGENHCLIQNANLGALVGKIGKHGDWFLVGKHYRADPVDTGKLYLAVNSDVPDRDGRTGGYTARIANRTTYGHRH